MAHAHSLSEPHLRCNMLTLSYLASHKKINLRLQYFLELAILNYIPLLAFHLELFLNYHASWMT